ncbi:MAG: glucose-1-phosphate thymidylyltransferase RfbA [Candidatus Ratteibacteria bacterium]|nr:glucose-1-phosphate thymidylyltransferase RfbA [Candidatus Ratteibacteria bacterium]
MKGIILAGGKATRLYPITKGVCKQMLPVYDKPMIYYPLSVLMLANIKDILIISTPKDVPRFKDLLGNGTSLGIKLSYAIQEQPKGIADSFIIGEKFIGKENICLILGDNIFFGHGLTSLLKKAASVKEGAVILGYYVNNPHRYGVIEFDKNQNAVSIKEKPKKPKSNCVVTGLYFFDNKVLEISKSLKPSQRGELEITDINNTYLKMNKLKVFVLERGYAWLDTGTYDSLIDASIFIKTIEERQGLKIGCIEEVAYRMGFINGKQLEKLAEQINTTDYGEYLKKLLNEKRNSCLR